MNTTMIIDTALEAARKISQIGEAANTAFVGRSDLIEAINTGLCCGEHLLMYGPPGTAKTSIGRYYGAALGQKFFYRQMGPDLTGDDFFGPVSNAALQANKWDRAWCNLADATIALVDEVGTASDTVRLLLFEAMEERTSSFSDVTIPLPLHCLWGGSNQTLHDQPAAFDRWTIRILLSYLTDEQEFIQMLRTNQDPPSIPVCREQLACLRWTAKYVAEQPSTTADLKLIAFKQHIAQKYDFQISDRRWRRILKVAAGSALKRGETQIDSSDLMVAQWMIWMEPSQVAGIQRFVEEECNKELRDFREKEALVNEFLKEVYQVENTNTTNPQVFDDLNKKAIALGAALPNTAGAKWDALRTTLSDASKKIVIVGQERIYAGLEAHINGLNSGENSSAYANILFAVNKFKVSMEKSGNSDMVNKAVNLANRVMTLSLGEGGK